MYVSQPSKAPILRQQLPSKFRSQTQTLRAPWDKTDNQPPSDLQT